MSATQTQEVIAAYTVRLYFKVPANVDAEKLLDEGRLSVRYGQLCLITKTGETIFIDPDDMPDYKYPDEVEIGTTDPYKGKYVDGLSNEEESSDEEEDEEDEEEEEDEN